MKDQFRSIDVIGKVKVPILVVHGERDGVVPINFGRELYAAMSAPKRFVALPLADHFTLFENGGVAHSGVPREIRLAVIPKAN